MEHRLFFLMNMARHRLFHHVDLQARSQLGVTATQIAGILFVHKNEGCLQGELAKALGLNKAAASGLTGRMETSGLIKRSPCASDGRAWRISLTKKAKDILPAVKPLLGSLNKDLTKGFSEDEILVVVRFLNHVMNRYHHTQTTRRSKP